MLRPGYVVALSLLLMTSCAASSGGQPMILYVATNGSDTWSGTLSAPNAEGTDGPFATAQKAVSEVRSLRSLGKLTGPVTVYLRGGTYYQSSTLTLYHSDSGTRDYPITYTSYPGETAVISGGAGIAGWKLAILNGKQVWAAYLPTVKDGTWRFCQLFVNGQRRERTRLPKTGFYRVAGLVENPPTGGGLQGQDKFRYSGTDIQPWTNLSGIDIITLNYWTESRVQIKSVDKERHVVNLTTKTQTSLMQTQSVGVRYWVENVREALDTPGQWYLDVPNGVLYYYPRAGEDMATTEAVAPKLDTILKLQGDTNDNVEMINFANLKFAHTQYILPAGTSGYGQAAWGVPAAVCMSTARECSLQNCEFTNLGTYAVELGVSCEKIKVRCNYIHDIGAGGIKIDPGSQYNIIADNDIGDGGKIFTSAVGVWIGDTPHNSVLHNRIHDLNYTGVSVGWVWGYGTSKGFDNHIEYNIIYNIGRGMLNDMGGVYTLGISPGTTIRNNLIHDIYCQSDGYGGWGIYNDEGSSNILSEHNVVYNTSTGGYHLHYGKNNTFRNNVIAYATEGQIQRSEQEDYISFSFDHNIVFYSQGVLLTGSWNGYMDYNIYYDASGRTVTFAGRSFADWRKQGHDQHSLTTDPQFVDPAHYNFTLKVSSPAFSLGIKQVDISTVGPRMPVGIYWQQYLDTALARIAPRDPSDEIDRHSFTV